jgi:hypothetical protein
MTLPNNPAGWSETKPGKINFGEMGGLDLLRRAELQSK